MQDNMISAEETEEEISVSTETGAEAEVPAEKLYTQSEMDSILNSVKEEYGKKLAEAEKLSSMGKEERDEYRRELLGKELAEREAAVAKRELAADAALALERAGLPRQLSACLNYSGRDECMNSLSAVQKAFEQAVSAAINERIRREPPRYAAGVSHDAFLDGLGM